METALEERAKEFLIQEISETIESCPNPDLAKSILVMSMNLPSYFEILHKSLGVTHSEVVEVVSALKDASLVRLISKGKKGDSYDIRADPKIRDYFSCKEFYGKCELFSQEGIDTDTAFRVMDSIKDIVRFDYNRELTFSLEGLEELRNKSHEALKSVRKAETEFFYETLEVPRDFSRFPTFVRDVDPTTSDDGYKTRTNRFNFYAKFNSPEQAFKVGFDKAYGTLITPSATSDDELRGLWHSFEIEREDDVYQIKIPNTRYQSKEHTIPLQREIQQGLEAIQERVGNILNI